MLIWITDGPDWHKMRHIIEDTFKEIDFAMNYQILEEKFDSIIGNI